MNCSVCCEHHNVSTSFFSVFPAGAGVILWNKFQASTELSFPRRCGGDPQITRFTKRKYMFSPQVRGWSWWRVYHLCALRVFPAGAGVIPVSLRLSLFTGCFPRRCGGDPIDSKKAELEELFSPQVRGWSHLRVILTLCGAVSPQVRGWSCGACFFNYQWSVFPAGAGVILALKCRKASIHSFPRRCGGDPPTDEIYVIDRASSRNNRGEPCLWHSHKSIRFFQKIRLLFQDISEWCN